MLEITELMDGGARIQTQVLMAPNPLLVITVLY